MVFGVWVLGSMLVGTVPEVLCWMIGLRFLVAPSSIRSVGAQMLNLPLLGCLGSNARMH